MLYSGFKTSIRRKSRVKSTSTYQIPSLDNRCFDSLISSGYLSYVLRWSVSKGCLECTHYILNQLDWCRVIHRLHESGVDITRAWRQLIMFLVLTLLEYNTVVFRVAYPPNCYNFFGWVVDARHLYTVHTVWNKNRLISMKERI